MNRQWLVCFVVLALFLLCGVGTEIALAQGDVTFQVKMNIKMREQTFLPGSGDKVLVRGDFNGFGTTDTLTDADNDSIYTKTVTTTNDTIKYKFFKTLRGGLDWESGSDRMDIGTTSRTLPVAYFDYDSVYTPPVPVNVTFQAKMNIKMRENAFLPGSGDKVLVRGSFNGFGSQDTLTDPNNDSIYTKVISLNEGAAVTYKYFKTLRSGLDWEGGSDRGYTVPTGGGLVPARYFDDDSVYTPPVASPVTFQVNMKIKMLENTFQPGSGDFVTVRGGFNGWGDPPGGNVDTLKDGNADSIYTKTISLNEGSSFNYKFWKTTRGGLDYETGSDHPYSVPVGGGTIPVRFFDGDSIANLPVSANILWQIDMNAYQTLGWYRPDLKDSIEVRGGFNGWAGNKMSLVVGGPGKYELPVPYTGTAGDQIFHKYFIDFDSAGATARFADYVHSGTSPAATRDGHAYEHPAETGDGNRLFTINSGGPVPTPPSYFSGISPKGLLLNTTDSVNLTFKVNMGPAKRHIDPFVPGVDTLRVVIGDALWVSAQKKIQPTFRDRFALTSAPNGGDSIYQVTIKVKGKTHYNLQYRYLYIHVGGAQVAQEGGLGGQNLFYSRFIQPTSPNVWPASYTFPLDVWKLSAPFTNETAPFTTGIAEQPGLGLPLQYALEQNFPNPFNPATRIRYTIPEPAVVTLKIFNLLGQEVVTLVNEQQAKGNYVALFDAQKMATGVYFYRLEAGKFVDVKKMLLLK